MLTQITPQHILDYTDANDFSELSHGMVYEAFCEQVVDKNEEYEIEALSEEWSENSTCTKEEFAEAKFDRVVGDELKRYLSLKQKEDWIDATVRGIQELTALND